MNRNFKVQWSRTKECNVVTSELVGTKGGKAKRTVQSIIGGSSNTWGRSFCATLAALVQTATILPFGVVRAADEVVGQITFDMCMLIQQPKQIVLKHPVQYLI